MHVHAQAAHAPVRAAVAETGFWERSWLLIVDRIFPSRSKKNLPQPGIYHFREKSAHGESRMHLRIESDGSGLLMVNASRVYHFNPTAAFMAYLVLENRPVRQAVKSITNLYDVHKDQAQNDYEHFSRQIKLIITPGYERAAKIIQHTASLSTEELQAFRNASKSINSDELSRTFQFTVLQDAEELIALIPAAARLEHAEKLKLIQNMQSQGHKRLASWLSDLDQLDPLLIDRLQALEFESVEADLLEPMFDTILPFSKKNLSAPYRMDLALTYQCNNRCHHCYNPANRKRNELDTGSWKQIIDHLWEVGIPHIIFTGGEPTLRSDLPELIAHAESNGQITGINTNGRRLKDPQYVQQLVDSGLDHVQITIESADPGTHDKMVAHAGAWEETVTGIKNISKTPLYFMTNTTMLQDNYHGLKDTLQFLADLGVERVGLNALIYAGQGESVGTGLPEKILPDLLVLAREMTEKHQQKLTWYTPTQYCHFDPVLFDFETLGVKGCTAALYNMCIEPNGLVLPCQSYYEPIGHILNDKWADIWNSDLAVSIRNRDYISEACRECSLLSVCGGGCPLAYRSGKISPPRAIHFLDAKMEEHDVNHPGN